MNIIESSELILDKNGRIYHLGLKTDDIADTIIMVGDPGRVGIVSGFFDRIETKVSNREFITHTGYYRGKKITVISTGIGTDNIDIVVTTGKTGRGLIPNHRSPNTRYLVGRNRHANTGATN